MATKTINLTGAEVAVTGLDGANAHIRNDGTDVIYAAKAAGISAGADGVLSIPAGQAATVYGISGTVYMLGTGSAQIISNDYSELPFKTSATSGGSGADEIARAAINAHSGNADIHVTAEDKEKWNAVNYSNPNLLINPDFAINQRGKSMYTYTDGGYGIDRWLAESSLTVSQNDDGTLNITASGISGSGFYQRLEKLTELIGQTVTLSICAKGSGSIALCANGWAEDIKIVPLSGEYQVYSAPFTINGNYNAVGFYANDGTNTASVTPKWIKLELGSIATPFTPPDPATELAKCQRYYQIRSTGDTAAVDMRPSMRATPTVTQLADGNYAYSAEL